MTKCFNHRGKQDGFTLVELLIVAIILAILAAIVVPQFASSTTDASNSALRSNLAGIRSAIDLYTQQHGGAFPASVASTGGACPAPFAAGGGAADSDVALRDQLRFYSNSLGQTCSVADTNADGIPEFQFGPYIKGDIPVNPVTDNPAIVIVAVGDLAMTGAGAGGGWRYDTTSGKFIADDTSPDGNGSTYDSY